MTWSVPLFTATETQLMFSQPPLNTNYKPWFSSGPWWQSRCFCVAGVAECGRLIQIGTLRGRGRIWCRWRCLIVWYCVAGVALGHAAFKLWQACQLQRWAGSGAGVFCVACMALTALDWARWRANTLGSYLACGGNRCQSLVAVKTAIFNCRKWFFNCRRWCSFLRGRCSISRLYRLWR